MKSVVDDINLNVPDGRHVLSARLGSVANETEAEMIELTGAGSLYQARPPGLLTQRLVAWFGKNIAASRVVAVSEMKNALKADVRDTRVAADIYLENVRDEARQKAVNASVNKAPTFIDKHRTGVLDQNQTLESYKNLRARIGREPVRTSKWLNVMALLLTVLLEAFINFERFMKVPYITSPFLATGATMAVGTGFA